MDALLHDINMLIVQHRYNLEKPKGIELKNFSQLNFKCLDLYAPFCPTVYLCDDRRGLVVCIGLKKVQHAPQSLFFFFSILTGLVCNECSRLAPLLQQSSNFKIAHIPVSPRVAFMCMSDFLLGVISTANPCVYLLCVFNRAGLLCLYVCVGISSKMCEHNKLNSYLQTHKLR